MSGQSTEPTRGIATEAHAGRPCPYCRFALKETVEIVQCGACGSIHHADCWDDNVGCSIMACPGGPGDRTHTTGSIPAVPPPPAAAPANTQSVPVVVSAAAPPPYQPPAPGPGPSRKRGGGILLISAIILLALAISGVAVALVLTQSNTPVAANNGTDGGAAAGGNEEIEPTETAAPEPDPTETAIPEPTPSALPDVPRSQMRRDIRDMLLVWHEDIVRGNYDGAWDQMTERKRRQNERKAGGYAAWVTAQDTLADHLDPSGLRVSIDDLDPRTGVARVMVAGMRYTKSGCAWRGLTWVRYENGGWYYDPGYSTTPQRTAEWESRYSELLGTRC